MVKAVWNGSKHDPKVAQLAACVGILESHYFLPPAAKYEQFEGKSWTLVRGHLGCHRKTLLAEVKRLKVGGSREMWLAYWKKDPFSADWYSASRFGYIIGVYGEDVGIRQWVTGEGWKNNEHDRIRSAHYARLAKIYRERYFK